MINPPTIIVTFPLFFFFFFFLLLSTIAVTSYSPDDHLPVNCGVSGNVWSIDQRNWKGDNGSTLFSLIDPDKVTQSIKPEEPVRSNPSIPFDTARLSRSEFSYSFPVTSGQPSAYNPDFLRSDAFFSVKAGPHTFLKHFNASVNADAGASLKATAPVGAIIREYCINVDPGLRLHITFTPNRSLPKAYAFVNGIEVVSMPNFLYYTNPEQQGIMLLDGGTQQF